ncbi:MAG: hypothetical protein ACOC4G_08235, partial [Bacillota bacterium]
MSIFNKISKWWKKISSKEIPLSLNQKKIFWGFIFVIVLTLILTIDLIPDQLDLKVGQPSPADIEAPRTMNFVDEERTEEMRDMARQSVGRVYEENLSARELAIKDINDFFLFIQDSKDVLENQEKDLDIEEIENTDYLTDEDII